MTDVGSNTLNAYFNCIGIPSSHGQSGAKWMAQSKNHSLFVPNKKKHKLPSAYMQLDSNFHQGAYPQIQLLDELHEEFPNSTFVINFRPVHDWFLSLANHFQMKARMTVMELPGLLLTHEQLQTKEQRLNFLYGRTNKQQEQKEEEPQPHNHTKGTTSTNTSSSTNRKLTRHRSLPQQIPNKTAKHEKRRQKKITKTLETLQEDLQLARWWCGHIKHIRH